MQIHVVQPGDTLWRISRRYGVSIDELIQLNRPPYTERLTPGQAFIVRVEQPPLRYTVRAGDTLWRISQRFGVTIAAILQLNPQITNPDRIFPGQVLLIPAPGPTPYSAAVNSYLVVQGEQDRTTVAEAAAALTYVSVFTYGVNPDGSLARPFDRPARESAQSLGVASIMTLSNFHPTEFRFSPDLARTILTDTAVQDRVVAEVLTTLTDRGFAGLNIDFEYVFPEDREAFNSFMRRLADELHPRGLLLSSALAPKISRTQRGLLYEAHDYPVHGEIADYVVLMTYEWGWVGGPPMAIAPLNQVQRVLDYAVTEIPRQKILMGIPLYARDWQIPWQEGTRAETLSVQEAVQRAIDRGVAIQYDLVAQSPLYRYTDAAGQAHEVWLEDARSIDAKLDLARRYQLGGISTWTLPAELPQVWPLVADRYEVRKRLPAQT
ncbi:MAG: LysM peptidoglycan-binding domain-containing protein [Limnochordales bacterium]|nr:LysM peptidoglycan-binding domain-containing protein [Limnochordales bacterium]